MPEVKIVNCLSRSVVLDRPGLPPLALPAAAEPVRVVPLRTRDASGRPAGVPLLLAADAEVVNLPEPAEGVVYLVDPLSALLLSAQGRWDVVAPCPASKLRTVRGETRRVHDGLLSWDASDEVRLHPFAAVAAKPATAAEPKPAARRAAR